MQDPNPPILLLRSIGTLQSASISFSSFSFSYFFFFNCLVLIELFRFDSRAELTFLHFPSADRSSKKKKKKKKMFYYLFSEFITVFKECQFNIVFIYTECYP